MTIHTSALSGRPLDQGPRAADERGSSHFAAELQRLRPLQGRITKRRQIVMRLYILDLYAIIGAFVIASILRHGSPDIGQLSATLGTILPVYFAITLHNNAHDAEIVDAPFRSCRLAATAFVIAAVSLLLFAFFMKIGTEFSRLMVGMGCAMSIVFMTGGRILIARWARKLVGPEPYAILCLHDGVPIGRDAGSGAVDARACGVRPVMNDLDSINRLAALATGMDRAIVYCHREVREDWCALLRSLEIPTEVAAPELNGLLPLSLHRRSGETTLQLSSGALAWNHRAVKRLFDLCVVLAALPFFLVATLVLGLLIKLESRGPVFFKQKRFGRGNRPFNIYKFRSMRAEASDARGDRSTSRSDERITRIGRFIRRTSLDELPQLINVLRGEMSIVGPRPHAEGSRAENQLFWDIDTRYWHRHTVKPGMTGLAQIRGFRGATEVKADLLHRLQADLEYVANWSLLGDIRIVIQTFAVLLHKNAF